MDILDETIEAWETNFKPIVNNIEVTESWGGIMFETYDPDLKFVRNCPTEHIWTLVDGDKGLWIVSGYHWVNRIGYFVTEIPWTKDYEVVVAED
jgi:hypothetical protein